jgi:hypothetical protein
MKRLALLALLLSPPVMAQDAPIETVTSSAASLAGLWKVSWPLSPPLPKGLGPEAVMYCRVGLARNVPAVNCFDRRNGVLTVSDKNIRIVWSPPMTPQSNVIEAEMTSPDSFSGSERVRMAGITVIRSGGLAGVRQQINPQMPDTAGNAPQLRRILEEIARGALSRPYERAPLVELPDAQTLHALGPVQSIIYQAKTNVWRDGAWIGGFFSLYLVEFQNGNRLCGLHQRDDGVLDAFRCV